MKPGPACATIRTEGEGKWRSKRHTRWQGLLIIEPDAPRPDRPRQSRPAPARRLCFVGTPPAFSQSIHYLSRGAIETAVGRLPVRPAIAAPSTIRRRLNPKIVELFPGSNLCCQPAWLFPAARPSLGRQRGISILRKHRRVRAPRVWHLLDIGWRNTRFGKPAQSLIKPRLFG